MWQRAELAKTIATIRSANLLPLVRWLDAVRCPTQRKLVEVDLGYWFDLNPVDPMPTLNAVEFLRNCARDHGPDFGCQVVGSSSIGELGYVGRIVLGARTPYEALVRVSAAIGMHSSHETIQIETTDTGVSLTQLLHLRLDPESLHAIHVLLSSLVVQMCLFTGHVSPVLDRIEIVAHPEFGLEHLKPWFGDVVIPSSKARAVIHIPSNVAHSPFRAIARDRLPQMMQMKIPPLADDNSLAGSVRTIIRAMLRDGEPTIGRVAASGSMSVRTLQRRLHEEGTNFSNELDLVRKKLASEFLGDEKSSIEEVGEQLGYSSGSAFSRAVRRFSGATPSDIRIARTG